MAGPEMVTTHPAPMSISTINLLSALMTTFLPKESTPPPFHPVWNYPDTACRSSGIDFNLASYGIESNSQAFIEDTIALYYSSLLGKWPYFEFGNDTDTPIHGGLPHRINFQSHIGHMHGVISSHQSPFSSGYGVIDMELWRPILKTNYGRYEPYREKVVQTIAANNPDLSLQEHRRIASTVWNLSTKHLMIMSLLVAKLTRPNTKWGYYGYPELSTAADNYKLEWLWKTVTAYYPSIYIKNFSLPIDEVEDEIKASIAEAFRVRALYGNPDHPIMAYTDVQSIPEDEREKWLKLAVQVPIEMGVDGIIMWASSKHFTPDIKSKCLGIQQYVQNTLGPRIKKLYKTMSDCSRQLCANHGRCVRKTYAKSIPFVINRGVNRRGHGDPIVSHMEYRKVGAVFKRDFMCQCKTGWYGARCVQKPHPDYDNSK